MNRAEFPEITDFHTLLNRVDWTALPLGTPETWPLSLRANFNLILEANVPMSIVWGPARALLYNAAYTQFLGDKHPWAVGRPLQEVWPEIWSDIGPLVDRACAGEAFHLEDLPLVIRRHGVLEQAWFTFFYSPVRDDSGAIGGMCSTVVETTSRMRAESEASQLNRTLEQRVAHKTAALQSSEAHLQSLFNQTAAGIAETNLELRIVRANAKYCAIVGRRPDEVIGASLRELVHPDDRDDNIDLLDRMVATGQPFEVENRYVRPDGTPVWVSKMVAPITGEGDRSVASILAVVVDITQRKQAEAQLRESVERLRLATDAAGLGIWRWDAVNDKAVWENDRMYEIFGIPRTSEAVNEARFLTEIIHPDDAEAYRRAVAQAFNAIGRFHVEGRFHRVSDRALRWFECTGVVHADSHDRPLRMVGTAADITARKELVEQLRMREERYRTLLASIDEGFCIAELIYDANGAAIDHRFLEINLAYERHTGLTNAVGKTAREMAPAIEQYWNDLYARVAASGEPERTLQYAEALRRWFDVFVSPVHDEARNKVAIVFRDITEQRRADAELRQLAADLAKANQRQSEFLATLAHELRNPLAPIRTGLDLMRLSPDNAASNAKIRDMMERQVDHLIHLVNDLLDLARVQSGKIELKKSRVALKDVVLSAVETALPLIQAKRHDLSVQAPDEPIYLDADFNRLAQVIGNLLTNAAKYTPEHGKIALTVQRDGDTAVVTVSDNGIGIPAEALPGLFEMFSQGRNGMDYAQGGLGIGLNLVKRLTEKHGGTATAASAGPNQGSTFTLRLPVAHGEAAAPVAAHAGPDGAGPQPLRILVADDNRDAADLLAQLLQSNGHRVHTEHDGLTALEAAKVFRPDLALLDIGMPGMNGYELAQALRRQPELAHTVLAAVTGWGSQDDRRRSREAGFAHHMTKPIDLDSLERLIAEIRPSASEGGR